MKVKDTGAGVHDWIEIKLPNAACVRVRCAHVLFTLGTERKATVLGRNGNALLFEVGVQQHALNEILFQRSFGFLRVILDLQVLALLDLLSDIRNLKILMTTILLKAVCFLIKHNQIDLEITQFS